jgi:PhnB protein
VAAKGPSVTGMTEPLTAWVISQDTAAEIAFLAAVFGAVEEPGARFLDGDRIGHAQISVRGVPLMLFDAGPGWPPTPAHLRVYVDDLEAALAAARERGATVFTEPTAMPFGDVVARFRDPQGHRWWVHQHVGDPDFTAEGMQSRLAYARATLHEEMRSPRAAGADPGVREKESGL